MADEADTRRRIVAAAMALTAERGWTAWPLGELADRAGVTLPQLYRHAPTRAAVTVLLARDLDETVLGGPPADPADTPRDRLFELLMRRFDALGEYRAGVAALLRALRLDPLTGLLNLPQLGLSMRWMLEAAGIPADGLRGAAKVQALAAIYLSVLQVWLRDEDPDLAQTMAALDRRLNQAERLANAFDRRRRGRDAAADPAPDPAGAVGLDEIDIDPDFGESGSDPGLGGSGVGGGAPP